MTCPLVPVVNKQVRKYLGPRARKFPFHAEESRLRHFQAAMIKLGHPNCVARQKK